MKKILMIIAISLIAQIAFAEELPDTPGNRLAAAEKYLEVYSFKEMMTDFAKKTSMNLPQNERQTYIDFIMQGVRFDVLERAAMVSMVRHFTVRELRAMTDFYSSPEGRSVMKKFGDFMADMMPVIEQEAKRTYQKYQANTSK